MSSLTPVTPRDLELFEMPTVISQFPIAFANGSECEEMDGECNACGKTLSREILRGLVSRPIETVAVIEAVGVCDTCKVFTRFYLRIHDDLRVTAPRENAWRTWHPEPSFLERLFLWLRNLMKVFSTKD